MSRALCVPFHRYQPHLGEYYKIYFDMLVQELPVMSKFFDKLYILDSDNEFTEDDKIKLARALGKKGFEIIPKVEEGHHWVQYKHALPHITEDYCLFLDNDVYFKDPGVIGGWFDSMINHGEGLVTNFDGSGGLKEQVQAKFKWMVLQQATRMGSYYFIADREVMELMKKTELAPIHYEPGIYIEELDYTTKEGDWSDSFGYLTIKIFGTNKIKIGSLFDPRDSIYLEDDGSITPVPEIPNNIGYYHLRNGNLPIYLLNNLVFEQTEDLERCVKITPRREILRLLVWFRYLTGITGRAHENDINALLGYLKVEPDLWYKYYNEFLIYHGLTI